MEEGGIYIHIPYCKNKCLYCDFYSGGERIADWKSLVEGIITEFESREVELKFNPETLYIGGGTPSLLPFDSLNILISSLNKRLEKDYWKEFTIEVNPEDVTQEKCEEWKNIGINRISLGLQTLNDHELKFIGRKHSASTGEMAIELLKEFFENISVDLMFGLPDQNLQSYEFTLRKVISLRPKHISSYSLMLEQGTALTLLQQQGKINLPKEEEWLKMFNITKELLLEAGYLQYEISNYAMDGFESRHNSNYWLGKPYLGLGPSAHSYDGARIRRANPSDIKGYLKHFVKSEKNGNVFYNQEFLSDIELEEEMIMTRLRMSSGLNLKTFEKKFGQGRKKISFNNPYLILRKDY